MPIRMEIACFFVILMIAGMFVGAKRERTVLHNIYAAILVTLMLHLIFDAITVITVNRLDTFPRFWNDVFHRLFLATMLFLIYLYYRYICELIRKAMRDVEHKRGIKAHKIVEDVLNVYLLVAEILIFVTPVSYAVTDKGNYEVGIGATVMFVSIPIFMFHMITNLLQHWKYLHPKERNAVGLAFLIEIVVTLLTAIDMSLLLAGMGLTLIAIAFYLVLENPDILLVEQVKKEKRKAEEANESKSEFLSIVSHEIRTPMNAIVGMTEMLLAEGHSEGQGKYLRNIKTSGDALVMIVNDLLDLSKIEAGKMEIIEDVYEWGPMIEDVRLIVGNRIGSKPIHIIIRVDKNLPDRLVGDSLRIRQVLINLMNNAVKFTESGYIQLRISVEKEDEEGFYLKYAVKDSGQGICSEDLNRLFTAFSQVDQKKNYGKEGTGLGLSISKDFVRLMGGELCVASEYGDGAEFFFTIYQKKARDGAKSLNDKANELLDKKFTAPDARILFVDDTAMNLTVATNMVKDFGMVVDTANSGKRALELLKENSYDIVFMDYMMPEMDGVETAKEIRAYATVEKNRILSQYYKSMPIVALTADTLDETKELFRKAGMDDYLEKPMKKVDIIRMLLKWLPKNKVIEQSDSETKMDGDEGAK